VKIDEADLPRAPNIHYLGGKSYAELPRYISGWDVALLPFARNESTRFISPTKTPEYLAAGLPVVSTSIRDVARPYEALGLVRIGDTVSEFVAACEVSLSETSGARALSADRFLADLSWDKTWREMQLQVELAIRRRLSERAGRVAPPASAAETQNIAVGGR
jgi:UDP-galactopyranose mutase